MKNLVPWRTKISDSFFFNLHNFHSRDHCNPQLPLLLPRCTPFGVWDWPWGQCIACQLFKRGDWVGYSGEARIRKLVLPSGMKDLRKGISKYLSAHKQFSQQNICLKAQKSHLAEQQLPHNSLQPLLNIRQELIQLDCWQLTISVLHCDSHCFRLSCLSKIAGLGLIEVEREHHMLSSQPIKTPAGSFDMALTQW